MLSRGSVEGRTRPIRKGKRERYIYIERERGEERDESENSPLLKIYYRCWIIEQCTLARLVRIFQHLYRLNFTRYYCLVAGGWVTGSLAERASENEREWERRPVRNACARDVSSRGSGVNYFTILFKETRVRNLRNEIPRRLAEAWLIFYRRPVYPISRGASPERFVRDSLPTGSSLHEESFIGQLFSRILLFPNDNLGWLSIP